ncbi:unnamed protein product [Mycena citricolor]|uniref:Autophagy-related protein 14 n=1 Tax=Mycena citricolor TaxID=2018698 RepID=A0AAD2HK57_9AGAR|nr:unnamed protein product [Mycena citricolor]
MHPRTVQPNTAHSTRDLRLKTEHFTLERDEQLAKANKALGMVESGRTRRAGVAQLQSRVEEITAALSRLRKDNDKKRDRLRTLRESLAARRRTLGAASTLVSSLSSSGVPSNVTITAPTLIGPLTALANLSAHISRARAGLVQELVDVFNVVEVGGRPPIGGKSGSQGEWTIGDLILPVPGDIRRYPPQHINAVICHTVQFLGLLSLYLGVKLPFDVQWEGGKLGVGVPWIGPGLGGWGRWTARHPLHLSLEGGGPATPAHLMVERNAADLAMSVSESMSESQLASSTATIKPIKPSADTENTPQFTTALAMLLYNVLFLAHSQGLTVPLAHAGDALSTLWAVCCAPELGRRAHATVTAIAPVSPSTPSLGHIPIPGAFPVAPALPPPPIMFPPPAGNAMSRLPAPSPALFPVDFAHVLQAAATGAGRRGFAVTGGVGRQVTVSGSSSSRGHERERNQERRAKKKERDRVEVEDGWDLVSEDGY